MWYIVARWTAITVAGRRNEIRFQPKLLLLLKTCEFRGMLQLLCCYRITAVTAFDVMPHHRANCWNTRRRNLPMIIQGRRRYDFKWSDDYWKWTGTSAPGSHLVRSRGKVNHHRPFGLYNLIYKNRRFANNLSSALDFIIPRKDCLGNNGFPVWRIFFQLIWIFRVATCDPISPLGFN